jgi:hypothetical protein
MDRRFHINSEIKPIGLSESILQYPSVDHHPQNATTTSRTSTFDPKECTITNARKATPLLFDFIPTMNEILCGRGAECLNHEGNIRFRQLIDDNLELYIQTKTKSGKSNIIREIVKRIRNQCYPGGFVRKDLLTGQYFEVGEFTAVSFRFYIEYWE